MNNNISQEIQKLITILFTQLDTESIIKLRNNEEFMNCIKLLQNINVENDDTMLSKDYKKIINPEAYEKYCSKNSVLEKYRNI